jgi:hypothetical protein
MSKAQIVSVPFIPDAHEQLANAGTKSHAQLETDITEIQTQLDTFEAGGTVKRIFTTITNATSVIDLGSYGFAYTPGSNSLIIFGNGVKQLITQSYVETDTTHITFTDPLVTGDEIEIYIFPFPVTAF